MKSIAYELMCAAVRNLYGKWRQDFRMFSPRWQQTLLDFPYDSRELSDVKPRVR